MHGEADWAVASGMKVVGGAPGGLESVTHGSLDEWVTALGSPWNSDSVTALTWGGVAGVNSVRTRSYSVRAAVCLQHL